MKALKSIIISFIGLGLNLPTFAQNQEDMRYNLEAENPLKLASNFNQTMNVCPQKIWDNYSWNNFNIFMVNNRLQKVHLWSGSTNKVSEYQYDEFPNLLKESLYYFFEDSNTKYMSLNIEADGSSKFEIGVHEAFHFLGQDQIATKGDSHVTRGSSYPLEYRARFLRHMLFKNIYTASFYTNDELNRKAILEDAKYWYQKWLMEYPEEAERAYDNVEGIPQYISIMAQAIVNTAQGCSASEEEIKEQALKLAIYNLGDVMLGKPQLRFDIESYAIGGFAAILLRFTEQTKDWQVEAQRGKSPVEILLQDYSPSTERIVGRGLLVEKQYRDSVLAYNQSIGQFVDDDLASYLDRDYIRLHMPLASYSARFFIAPQILPNTTVFSLAEEYNTAGSSGRVKLKENAVMFINGEKPDSCEGYTILVHKNDVEQPHREIFSIESEKILAFFSGTKHTDDNGMMHLCIK